MKVFSIKTIILIILLHLTGCAQEEGTEEFTPTDPNSVFKLFPYTYFLQIYDASYNLYNTNSSDGSVAFWQSFQGAYAFTYNGESVISVRKFQMNYTTEGIGTFGEFFGHIYYSIDITDLRLLGFNDTLTGISATSTTTTAIPEVALIGSSGNVGSYIDSTGSTIVIDWELMDGGNGFAKLVFSMTTTDQYNVLLFTSEESYLIDRLGNRSFLELVLYSNALGSTLDLSGAKI